MRIHGIVVKGLGIGKKLGYPTANLEISGDLVSDASETKSPHIAPGVYAARATFDGAAHDAVVVIGARPAQISASQKFQSGKRGRPLVEVFLLDFKGDLYGKKLSIEVLKKVSEIEQFDDEKELKRKIESDIKQVKLSLRAKRSNLTRSVIARVRSARGNLRDRHARLLARSR